MYTYKQYHRPVRDGSRRGLTRSRPVRLGFVAMCIVICIAISACGRSGNDPAGVKDAAEKAQVALNSAIDRLESDLLNYRKILDDLKEEVAGLDGEIATLIRQEATDLARRTIAAAGVEFRCNADFVGQRALEGLHRILAHVNGDDPTIKPSFCSATPSSIDLNLAPERRNRVDFTGYNFDVQRRAELILVKSGAEVNVSRFLTSSTPYEMTANLGGGSDNTGVQLTEDTERLELRWNGETLSQVAVLQKPALPKCVPETTWSKATSHTIVPQHTGEGDKELFGKADVWINVSRVFSAATVDATISMKVRQYDDDHSTAEGTSEPIRLYDVPAGRKIVSVGGPERDPELYYRDADWEDDHFGGGNGLVARYEVRAEGPREDLNGYARATVYFNPLQVQTIATSGCVE